MQIRHVPTAIENSEDRGHDHDQELPRDSPYVVQHDTLPEVEAEAELPFLPLDQVALQLHCTRMVESTK